MTDYSELIRTLRAESKKYCFAPNAAQREMGRAAAAITQLQAENKRFAEINEAQAEQLGLAYAENAALKEAIQHMKNCDNCKSLGTRKRDDPCNACKRLSEWKPRYPLPAAPKEEK